MVDNDVLQERIREFKESLKRELPDMDVSLLLRILDIVNDSSEMFVASNPLHDDNSWVKDCPKFAVSGIEVTPEGKLMMRLSSEKHGLHAEDLKSRVKRAVKGGLSDRAQIVFTRKGDEVRITDAFSHTLVREHWSGMPFDIILASVTERVPKIPEGESAE